MNLTRKRWAALTPAERTRTAKALAKELPDGFAFDRVRVCKLGTQKNAVAFYTLGDARFALIPDGRVTVGYDKDRPWTATATEAASWRGTAEEYGLRSTVQQHVARVTRRPRTVNVPALLVETIAGELGWEPIAPDDPEVRAILRRNRQAPQVTVFSGGTAIRVTRGEGKAAWAERNTEQTHAQLSALLKKGGFRFPTVDEWEYLCGAGSETLFRWGDHVPCDCYPVDGAADVWGRHRRPNAFGLVIATDPYKSELTAKTGTTRGGDGGSTVCGGAGYFVGWLTLATAYYEPHACRHDPAEPIDHSFTIGRRVLELT
jgi:hypothetical protein